MMNNIWQILQIEPTTDKRAIKKAYAKRSREVHPEERPEEFSQLHESYKEALLYAKLADEEGANGERQEGADEEGANRERRREAAILPTRDCRDSVAEAEEISDIDLYKYFLDKEEKTKENLEEFKKQWEKIVKSYGLTHTIERWAEYMKSEDFQEIRWNPLVLECLVDELDKLRYFPAPKLALWDAYGFDEEKRLEYHGDILRLFEALVPICNERRQMELEEQRRLENIKVQRRKKDGVKETFKFALLLLCALVPILIYNKLTEEGRFVSTAMQKMYPDDSFTVPEKEEGGSKNSAVYSFYSRNHPEIRVEAVVTGKNKSDYSLDENYGQQLFQYYADSYGLECDRIAGSYESDGQERYGSYDAYVVFYPDIEEADRVCDSLLKMLEEQGDKELSYVDEVGICWENAMYREVMLGGGVKGRPMAQIYSVDELPEKETLRRSVEEAFVDYMYNYEAWNLTPEQKEAYGPAYVARGRAKRVADSGDPWSSDHNIKEIEKEMDLYIYSHL